MLTTRHTRLPSIAAVTLTLTMLLYGCSQPKPAAVNTQNVTHDVATTGRVGELTRSVLAVFETDEVGGYAVSVRALYDIPTSHVGATARGKLTARDGEEIYFVAENSGRPVILVIDDSFTTASLRATLMIVRCTNEEWGTAQNERCPVGLPVEVSIDWSSNQPLETIGPANSLGEHPGRGRTATATGTIGASSYTATQYAVIQEHLTFQ